MNLLHHRQLGGFSLAYQRTFGDQGPTDTPRNGRGDLGVTKVDFGLSHGCFACCNVSLCCFVGRFGIHEVLLADGIGSYEGAKTFNLSQALCQLRLCACHLSSCAFQCSGIRCSVNLEQQLACPHVAAFAERALLQDACTAGANLRCAYGFDATR